MGVQITKKKAAVQPVAQDDVLEEVGLVPGGGVTIVKKAVTLPIGAKVRVKDDSDICKYYGRGDTGVVEQRWDAVREIIDLSGRPKHELDIYRVRLDNPRQADHEAILLRKHEIEPV